MAVARPPGAPLVHIGFYKAASTWLQKYLFVPSCGFDYVLDAFALHSLLVVPPATAFDPDQVAASLAGEIAAIAGRDRVPVLSSESLSGDLLRSGCNRWQNADRLQQVLGQARILLVVREQQQLLRSMYKTMVLWGLPGSIGSLLRTPAPGSAPTFDLDFIRFHDLAQYYATLFGQESVLVLPYELFRQRPLEFISRVYAHCDREPAPEPVLRGLPLDLVENPGESLAYIHLQRWANRLTFTRYRDYAGYFNNNGFEQILRRVAWHKRNARATPLDAALERRFARQVNDRLAGKLAASNRALQAFCPVELRSFAYEM